ncbi:MAG: type II toxin-antitoxin system Phd/YefM family antitoxin [Actinobacteria bacterium]|nr:type II toxin-antitoxin system Phd/YefM family antitoxin [Actinomycetota bacterium]
MMPIADARAQLSRFIDEATSTHERFEITRNGHRAAIHAGDRHPVRRVRRHHHRYRAHRRHGLHVHRAHPRRRGCTCYRRTMHGLLDPAGHARSCSHHRNRQLSAWPAKTSSPLPAYKRH